MTGSADAAVAGRRPCSTIVQPHPLCSPRAGHGEGTSALGEGLHFSENKKTSQEVSGDKHVQYETRKSSGKLLKLFAQELEMEW